MCRCSLSLSLFIFVSLQVSATHTFLKCITPASDVGTRLVSIHVNGRGFAAAMDEATGVMNGTMPSFRYALAVTNIDPSRGPLRGGQHVVIQGEGFTASPAVAMGTLSNATGGETAGGSASLDAMIRVAHGEVQTIEVFTTPFAFETQKIIATTTVQPEVQVVRTHVDHVLEEQQVTVGFESPSSSSASSAVVYFRLAVAGCATDDIVFNSSVAAIGAALQRLDNVVRVVVRDVDSTEEKEKVAAENKSRRKRRTFVVRFEQIDQLHPGCALRGQNNGTYPYNGSTGWNQAGAATPPPSMVGGNRRRLLSSHGSANTDHDPMYDGHHHDDHDVGHGHDHHSHHHHNHHHHHHDNHHDGDHESDDADGDNNGADDHGRGRRGHHHKCIHDDINHRPVSHWVDYGAEDGDNGDTAATTTTTNGFTTGAMSPLSLSSSPPPTGQGHSSELRRYRRLFFQEDSYTMWQQKQWDPIRVRVNTENVEMTDPVKFTFLTEKLLPLAAAYLSQVLSVVPVRGRLRLSEGSCSGLGVPPLYQAPGVGDTDLVIFVNVEDTEEGILAWSSPCFMDQYGRPTAGRLTISSCALDASEAKWTEQFSIVLHELIHILGFSQDSFRRFRDPFDPRVSAKEVLRSDFEWSNGMKVNKIVSNRAVEMGRAHFGCPSMDGLPLENQRKAPVLGEDHPEKIECEYIVTFHPDTTVGRVREIKEALAAFDGDTKLPTFSANVTAELSEAFRGALGCFTPDAVAYLRELPEVTQLEADKATRVSLTYVPSSTTSSPSSVQSYQHNQENATGGSEELRRRLSGSQATDAKAWNLDRIDGGLNGKFDYGDQNGEGVTVFVLDTGINCKHKEFDGGRCSGGFSSFDDAIGPHDCQGHGTHCAGTVGGKLYGVAKKVKLIPVRVLGCSGSGSGGSTIKGIEWVISQVKSGKVKRPAIASMSLGSGYSAASNAAVAALVAAGITTVVAAGNDNQDACGSSPASEPTAITVGASDPGDKKAGFSNHGPCLDIYAPGTKITSANHNDNTGYNEKQGTSMACPAVAGVAALAAQAQPEATPKQITKMIMDASAKGALSGLMPNDPNSLLQMVDGGASAAPKTPEALTGPGDVIKNNKPPAPGVQDDPQSHIPNPPAGPAFESHWESRLFDNEIMAPHTNGKIGTVLSVLTLGVLEDSGWYVGRGERGGWGVGGCI